MFKNERNFFQDLGNFFIFLIKIVGQRNSKLFLIYTNSFIFQTPSLEGHLVTFYEANNKCISGKLHSITEDNSESVIVSVNMYVSTKLQRAIKIGEWFRLIPRPPKSEKLATKRLIAKWAEYEASRKKLCTFLTGTIHGVSICGEQIWNNALSPFKVWKLQVEYNNVYLSSKITDLLRKTYVALEATLDVIVSIFILNQKNYKFLRSTFYHCYNTCSGFV